MERGTFGGLVLSVPNILSFLEMQKYMMNYILYLNFAYTCNIRSVFNSY